MTLVNSLWTLYHPACALIVQTYVIKPRKCQNNIKKCVQYPFAMFFLQFENLKGCFVCICLFYFVFLFQALRSDSAPNGQALGETRKQLKEETLLRLVRFVLFYSSV